MKQNQLLMTKFCIFFLVLFTIVYMYYSNKELKLNDIKMLTRISQLSIIKKENIKIV